MQIKFEHTKDLSDYQLEELVQEKLLINKYNLDLKYNYELAPIWKEMFFDMLNQNSALMEDVKLYNLFDYMKKNYNNIIDEYGLDIDIRDYIDLTDYLTLKEWLTENKSNNIRLIDNHFVLSTSIVEEIKVDTIRAGLY